jgi:hypothetical protein
MTRFWPSVPLFAACACAAYAASSKQPGELQQCNKLFKAKVVGIDSNLRVAVRFDNGIKRNLSDQEKAAMPAVKAGSRLCLQDDAD